MMHKSPVAAASLPLPRHEIMKDFRVALISRHASLAGRKEVLGGKAKFGIFGDGKEVAQLAMARAFRLGDWRSGYYRDQTFMFAIGACTVRQFFAQLYANPSLTHEPASAGRQMNSHFASRYLSATGEWLNQCQSYNIAADLSPTAGQMARLVGLAYASKLYRQSSSLQSWTGARHFSQAGNEVAFGTIGNASTSEGLFWESLNAAGVLQVPLAISVWDDGYGISVPNTYQTTKGSLSEVLEGFRHKGTLKGYDLYQVKGHDYPALLATYNEAINRCRQTHSPCVIHVVELTQPQGHSTSGSHERYKSLERLTYEQGIDCLAVMRQWLLSSGLADEQELAALEEETQAFVRQEMQAAWQDLQEPINEERQQALGVLQKAAASNPELNLADLQHDLEKLAAPLRRQIQATLEQAALALRLQPGPSRDEILSYLRRYREANTERFSSHQFVTSARSPLHISGQAPTYSAASPQLDGRQIIQRYFDMKLDSDPRLFVIGEDIGKLGGVNLEFEGLNAKHGELRVTDTGIREATIFGQGMGAAMRGLRPIADIQYLDYLLYCLQGMSDDLASLHYRSAGGQAAPLIVRTKGHRLEGIWHSGSPLGMIIHAVRGVHVCVPRNSVQAAGMYETLLQGDDPALVIEVLNGYRVKERCPDNLGAYSVPLGVPEILAPGDDITIVTYGANVRIAEQALTTLQGLGISCELIDVQTLLPFDVNHIIAQSLHKTNAVIFFDEDVPGGASAYMMQQVLETQAAFDSLDAAPRTLCSKAHRPPFGSDGDYFAKPNAEDLINLAYEIMHERNPDRFPACK